MARRKFAKLKALMFEQEVTQADIAKAAGRSLTYIASRMTGREVFDLNDMKVIAELLDLSREKWLDYFMEDKGN